MLVLLLVVNLVIVVGFGLLVFFWVLMLEIFGLIVGLGVMFVLVFVVILVLCVYYD